MAGKSGHRAWGNIRKLPSGRWQASYLGPDDQRHTAETTFAVKRAAEGWLSSEHDLIELDRRNLGVWTPPAQRTTKALAAKAAAEQTAAGETLREYAMRWLENKVLADHSRRSYEQALRLHILPALGDKVLTDITPEDVRRWFAKMGSDAETARARAYGALTAVLNTAVEDELIARSPARIKGGTAVKHTKRSVVLLEPHELAALADKLHDDLRLTVLLAGWCGLRRGEVFALTRGDVAADGSVLRIDKAADTYGRVTKVGPTKTRESKRTVSVPTHLRGMLVDHLSRHVNSDTTALLFNDAGRGHWTEGRYRPHFVAAREAIGKDDLHFHDLRHFGGVMAAVAGATTKEVMDRLGHTTSSAAMRYQHVAAGRADAIADRLSELAKPQPSNSPEAQAS